MTEFYVMSCTRPGCTNRPARPRPEHAERVMCDTCSARPPIVRVDSDWGPFETDHTHSQNGGTDYHQDQDQDQDQGLRPLNGDPGPGGNQDQEPGILEIALGEYRRGNPAFQPVDVALEIPAGAGAVMKAVAEHMRLLMGLRLALGDHRPLPYATSMPVRAGITHDKGIASRAIRALVDAKVITHVGSLPPLKPGLDGTKLYEPPADGWTAR